MKKVALLLSVILIATCGGSETSKPTALTGGLFVNSGSDPQTPVALNFNNKGTDPTVDVSNGGVVLLTFSGFLNGLSIEQTARDPVTKVVKNFLPLANLISVTVGGVAYSGYGLQYRPDGGYVPPPDTTADNFPKPAIAIQFPSGVASGGKQVIVKLMDQIVVGVDGAWVQAGSVSFIAK